MPVCYPLNSLSFPGQEETLLLKGKRCLRYTVEQWRLAPRSHTASLHAAHTCSGFSIHSH